MLGLRLPQLVGFVIVGAVALAFLNAGRLVGLLLALAVVGAAGVLLLVPVRGHTAQEWAPLTLRFLLGGSRRRFRAQLAQVGHVVALPEGGLDPQRPEDPRSVPSELAGLEYLEGALAQYDDARMGVVVDRRARTYTAVLRCQGRAFTLLAAEEREQRLAEYAGVLAALARDDSPIRRVAWIERSLPADGDEMAAYLMDHKRAELALEDRSDELVSYLQLLARAPEVAEDHELLFCVQIDAHRAGSRRAIRRLGGGDLGAVAVLGGELGQVAELLLDAGILVTGVLTRRGVAAAIRDAYDPWGRQRRMRAAPQGIAPMASGPAARDEHWSHIATDGALHSTLWVAEWPRIDVRALFLQPLLVATTDTRTVAMVMELVGPGRAIRQVERAATEASSEEAMRHRVGQRTTQRQRQNEDATHRREAELAQGHAQVRFAAYVTVSARRSEVVP